VQKIFIFGEYSKYFDTNDIYNSDFERFVIVT